MVQELPLFPLFPLSTVLFPGMVLPLHIFEPRYRQMMADCLESEQAFGVVLIARGAEVGENAEPYRVGTTARITQVERLPDGRMNILTVGTQRFHIRKLYHHKPYLVGSIEVFAAEDADSDEARYTAVKVRPLIETYVRLLHAAAGVDLGIKEVPSDPTTLAYLSAIAMQISLEDKQSLLATASIPALLNREVKLLQREEAILEFVARTHASQEKLMMGPTGNLSLN